MLSRATSPAAERIARGGQRRLCQLLHLPHLAAFVAGLLRRYAALYPEPPSPRLHHRVRALAEAHRNRSAWSGGPRVLGPERLWAELSGGRPPHCGDLWWHDPRCQRARP